ncbi:MAG: methyltransferase domain-containing protein [Chloroflexota bacterium]|nr:methyltransferase domain-containing protein [Chloroflexota bacterium]
MTRDYFFLAVDDISEHYDQILIELKHRNLPQDQFKRNFKALIEGISINDQFDLLLSKIGFEYLAPYDARHLGLADSSIDLYYSRTVLEHVAKDSISDIYIEAHRVLKPNGYMIHLIDIDDHWSYFDKSISRLNFLKYKDSVWNLINSPIAYQNRLRSKQHLEIIESSGFSIEKFIPNIKPLNAEEIDLIREKIQPEFSQYSDEELSIGSFYVLAKPLDD